MQDCRPIERGHSDWSGATSVEPKKRSGTLAVIGSNPPTTSGARTLARAELAREILGFERMVLANLFGVPTYRTGEITQRGIAASGWKEARVALELVLGSASGVFFAFGVGKPAGDAARHHEEQLRWLEEQIAVRALPVWWVGGAPRHPSRWQRYTFRVQPDVPFRVALTRAIERRQPV